MNYIVLDLEFNQKNRLSVKGAIICGIVFAWNYIKYFG